MIREHRKWEKLQTYYEKYVTTGVMDPNVHPWVAESWQRSREADVPRDLTPPWKRLSVEELQARRETHQAALHYLSNLYKEMDENFNLHQLSLLLLDADGYVLKNFSLPFYQKWSGDMEGARLREEDVGTSSVSIAINKGVPFYIFGPEQWLSCWQEGESCTAPIYVNQSLQYLVTLVAAQAGQLPYTAINALLLSARNALEAYLVQQSRLEALEAILDAVPHAVYHMLPGGEVAYTNKLGRIRLAGIGLDQASHSGPNLSQVVTNFKHTPLYKGLLGIPSHNKEVTWITQAKTYEDITTVVPLYKRGTVEGIVAVSQPIEDLRTLVAHAVGYTARYHLNSMVGNSHAFTVMKEKAMRLARGHKHGLLQGESGTGKQRLVHGIHQASSRAGGPLISVRCGDMPAEMLEVELFGRVSADGSSPGKLELANGGTLFLDEIEKVPLHLQARLAEALVDKTTCRTGESIVRRVDVRLMAACDSDVKRLAEKKMFGVRLYQILSRSAIKVPALRNRKEDIPLLAEHIIDELSSQHNLARKQLDPEAAQLLCSYEWPGNIKQLQGVVEQAFFNTEGTLIHKANLVLPGETVAHSAWKQDREIFLEAWQAAGGNISRLANMLDVSRVTLYRYLKKYNLERD